MRSGNAKMTIWECLAEGLEFFWRALGVVFFLVCSLFRWSVRWLRGVFASAEMQDLTGSVVVITGAASGLGQAIALQLATCKCRLVLLSKHRDDLNGTLGKLTCLGVTDVCAYGCDLRTRDNINETVRNILSDMDGRITVLINNAGVAFTSFLEDLSADAIQETLDVNLTSHFWLMQAFLPALKRQPRSHIVCIASVAGLFGASGVSAYCASKFGLVGLCESLAMELHVQKSNVKVTCVCPYQIDTQMFAGVQTCRYQWLFPILKVDYVAQRVVKCLFSYRHVIYMPRLMYLLPVVKTVVPHCFMLRVADFLGITTAAQSASKNKTE